MVRIVVFHTWLRGEDWQALATGDGTRGYSIDHGYFLTGASWNLALIEGNTPVEAVVMSQFHANLPKDQAAFRGILDELCGFSETAIVEQFSAIPSEWGVTNEFAAKLAHYVLQRRAGVERAIATLW